MSFCRCRHTFQGVELPAQDYRAKEASDQVLKGGQPGHSSYQFNRPTAPLHTHTHTLTHSHTRLLSQFCHILSLCRPDCSPQPSNHRESETQLRALLPQGPGLGPHLHPTCSASIPHRLHPLHLILPCHSLLP